MARKKEQGGAKKGVVGDMEAPQKEKDVGCLAVDVTGDSREQQCRTDFHLQTCTCGGNRISGGWFVGGVEGGEAVSCFMWRAGAVLTLVFRVRPRVQL